MNDIEYIHEFALDFSEKMLACGANLERTVGSVNHICDIYGCQEVNFFAINCFLTLSMKDAEGNHVAGQRCNLEGVEIDLEKLGRLHRLSKRIYEEKPEPRLLNGMLEEALDTKGYTPQLILLAFLIIQASIGMLFDAGVGDIITILLNAALIFLGGVFVKHLIPNRIVYSALCTFVLGSVAIFMKSLGVAQDASTVMIVNSLVLLPGIDMVNSFRNLLCGSEINGAVELLKVVMTTFAIVGGFVLSMYIFGGMIA